MASDFEIKIGYTFKNSALLTQALTHPSHSSAEYERLEFLGDRVLGLIAAEMLFHAFPEENEGHLAKRHSALVRADMLAILADEIDLGRYLILSEAEAESGGRKKKAILADAMEAMIGAIYLDGGMDRVAGCLRPLLTPHMERMENPPEDPKTALQEYLQAHDYGLPVYHLVEQSGPPHDPVFTIEVMVDGLPSFRGQESSKRAAEKIAARKLLDHVTGKKAAKE